MDCCVVVCDAHDVLYAQSPPETTMMMMMKMQKDAELDKKIEALRKKNEALMKRYQVRMTLHRLICTGLMWSALVLAALCLCILVCTGVVWTALLSSGLV